MEQLLTKTETISKIKKGSLIIGVLCLLTAIFYALLAFTSLGFGSASAEGGAIYKATVIRIRSLFAFNFATMLCASALFYRIRKSGKPFSRGNIIIVRTMGGLTILSGFVPALLYAAVLKDPKMLVGVFDAGAIVSGLLILFIAQIMHYGSMLQQESDETL